MSDYINVKEIKSNPNNPRIIKDKNFKKLVKSIKSFPVMLEKRKIMLDEDNIIIGGNMRFKAVLEAGINEVPYDRFTREDAERNNKETDQEKTYEEYVSEFIIKDNVSGGEWDYDVLANEWDQDLLDAWGVELPGQKEIEEDGEAEFTEELGESHNYVVLYFDNDVDWLQLQSLYDLKTVKALDSKSNYEKKGVGRVVKGIDFINELLK